MWQISLKVRITAAAFLSMWMAAAGCDSKPDVPARFLTIVNVPVSDEKLSDLLAAETKKACAIHQQPIIEFYSGTSAICNTLHERLDNDKVMIDAFRTAYIIRLDADAWKPQLKKQKRDKEFSIGQLPAFYELDSDGIPTGRFLTEDALGDNTPATIAPIIREFLHY